MGIRNGIVLQFAPRDHAPTPSTRVMPKRPGSTVLPFSRNASDRVRCSLAGMRPRARQLLTADEPVPVNLATAVLPPSSSMTAATVSSIAPECSHIVNMSSLHALEIVTACELRPNGGMGRSLKDVSERLVMTQKALGISPAELCRLAKISPNAWTQYTDHEYKRRITLAAAYKLKDQFGLTLEWIFDGDTNRLPHDFLVALRKRRAAA